MKNLKKKLSARGGFTLVELIVVIAILAILAGVGTAAYSGYIKKAQDAADLQTLDAVKTATFSLAAMEGKDVTKITVTVSNGSLSTVKYTPSGESVGEVNCTTTDITELTGALAFRQSGTIIWNASSTSDGTTTAAGWGEWTTTTSEGGGEGA